MKAAFIDPAGGGGSDSMAGAIGHLEYGKVIIDAIREYKPSFSPRYVVEELSGLLKRYGIRRASGDRYSGQWAVERFRECGVRYEPCSVAKSDLYLELLPVLNAGEIELPDHPELIHQLCNLERRTRSGGKDKIDHLPGGHDDLANVVAGAAYVLLRRQGRELFFIGTKGLEPTPGERRQAPRNERDLFGESLELMKPVS